MSKCPICGTHYGKDVVVGECGGEGKCPAREAGERPTMGYVLCACNRRWLEHASAQLDGHGYEDCKIS